MTGTITLIDGTQYHYTHTVKRADVISLIMAHCKHDINTAYRNAKAQRCAKCKLLIKKTV